MRGKYLCDMSLWLEGGHKSHICRQKIKSVRHKSQIFVDYHAHTHTHTHTCHTFLRAFTRNIMANFHFAEIFSFVCQSL